MLLVSGVFIILPATLDWETIRAFEARFIIFLLLLLFVVRPLTVLVSLFLSKVPWKERLFIAWIAPRGVVAVAITGLFALRLTENGVTDADALIPLSFGVVVATIFAHGFTAQRLSERLGLDKGPGRGILLIGANSWTIEFGALLKSLDLPVTVADSSKLALRAARKRELEIYRGDILDEVTHDRLDLKDFQQLVAATDNDAYNALVCADLGPEIGYESVSQIGADRERAPVRGRVLMPGGPSIEELVTRQLAGWQFSRTRITEEYSLKDHLASRPDDAESLAVLKPDNRLLFFSTDARPVTEAGDVVISYAPPETAMTRRDKKAAQAAERPASPE